MFLKKPEKRSSIQANEKLDKAFTTLESLIDALGEKDLPQDVADFINQHIEGINAFSGTEKELLKRIQTAQREVLKRLEKQLKLVPKNYYRKLWMALGMTVYGLPFGVAMGAALGSMAFLGIGLPIGMAIGLALGSGMDNKAKAEGRQLDVDL